MCKEVYKKVKECAFSTGKYITKKSFVSVRDQGKDEKVVNKNW